MLLNCLWKWMGHLIFSLVTYKSICFPTTSRLNATRYATFCQSGGEKKKRGNILICISLNMDRTKQLLYFYWSFVADIILVGAYGCYSRWKAQGRLFGKRGYLNGIFRERRDSHGRKSKRLETRKEGTRVSPAETSHSSRGQGEEEVGEKLDCPYLGVLPVPLPFLSTLWATKDVIAARSQWIQRWGWRCQGPEINCWRLIHLHIW